MISLSQYETEDFLAVEIQCSKNDLGEVKNAVKTYTGKNACFTRRNGIYRIELRSPPYSAESLELLDRQLGPGP